MNGVGVHLDKIHAIVDWPIPKNVKDLRGFIGLTGYYRRIVRNYEKIARALTDLTKKNAFFFVIFSNFGFSAVKRLL